MSKVMAELELDKQIKEQCEIIRFACTKGAVKAEWIDKMLEMLLKMQKRRVRMD